MKWATLSAMAILGLLGGCALVLEDYDQYQFDPKDENQQSDSCAATCYQGPTTLAGVGACVVGIPTCDENNVVIDCSGDVLPVFEVCSAGKNDVDDDCNGFECLNEDLWSGRIGDLTNVDTLTGMTSTSGEGIVLAGNFTGTIGLGGGKSLTSAQMASFIGKYGAGGVAQWIVQPIHTVNFSPINVFDVAVDGNGKVYYVGNYVYVNGGLQYGFLGSRSGIDGSYQTSNFEFGNANGAGNLNAIDVDGDGVLYVAGTILNSVPAPCLGVMHDAQGTQDLLVARASGPHVANCLGAVVFDGGPHFPTDVASGVPRNVGEKNSTVVVGNYGGVLDALPVADPNFPSSFILQLDGDLKVAWSSWLQPSGGQSSVDVRSVATDAEGFIYVVGTVAGAVSFATRSGMADADGDMFVAKYDPRRINSATMTPDPEAVWVRILGGKGKQKGTSIAVARKDRIYVAGVFDSTIDLGISLPVTLPANASGPFWIELSKAGDVLWVHTLGLTDQSGSMQGIAPDSLLLSPALDDDAIVALAGTSVRPIQLGVEHANATQDIFYGLIRRTE